MILFFALFAVVYGRIHFFLLAVTIPITRLARMWLKALPSHRDRVVSAPNRLDLLPESSGWRRCQPNGAIVILRKVCTRPNTQKLEIKISHGLSLRKSLGHGISNVTNPDAAFWGAKGRHRYAFFGAIRLLFGSYADVKITKRGTFYGDIQK
jgi:hypothetical protein